MTRSQGKRERVSAAHRAEPPVIAVGPTKLVPRHIEIFLSRLAPPDENGCVLWTRSTDRRGYGQFGAEYRMLKAHQVSWILQNGPIPEGLVLDHLCENPPCCNPEHLEPVTPPENVRRWRDRMTHCVSGKHLWSEQDPILRSGGRKLCRPCQKAHRKAEYEQDKRKRHEAGLSPGGIPYAQLQKRRPQSWLTD